LPPLLLVVARTSSQPGLSPRHLAYLLPFFAGMIGVGAARAARPFGAPGAAAALLAAGVVLVASPLGGIRDPRDWLNDVLGGGPPALALGSEQNLAPAQAWLERNVDPGAVLFPYSAVYLAALPATRHATALPYAQRETLLRALPRIHTPVRELLVSVPVGASRLDRGMLDGLVRRHFEVRRFGPWLLLRGDGPFRDDRAVLLGVYEALAATRDATVGQRAYELDWYYRTTLSVLCSALRRGFQGHCPPPELTWLHLR
jgi:hypothetical protein